VARWLKRIMVRISISLVSLISGSFCLGVVLILTAIFGGHRIALSLLGLLIIGLMYGIVFALPGWILSLPLILFVPRVSECFEFTTYLLIGTFMGPLSLTIIDIVFSLHSSGNILWPPDKSAFLGYGAVVAFASTLIYLLLLRRLSPERIQHPS
jgi:hypothetical protein